MDLSTAGGVGVYGRWVQGLGWVWLQLLVLIELQPSRRRTRWVQGLDLGLEEMDLFTAGGWEVLGVLARRPAKALGRSQVPEQPLQAPKKVFGRSCEALRGL